jgi:signal transduction histidine kinase
MQWGRAHDNVSFGIELTCQRRRGNGGWIRGATTNVTDEVVDPVGHSGMRFRHSAVPPRDLLLLVAVVSAAMGGLGWWMDHHISPGSPTGSGEEDASARLELILAIGCAWAAILVAILLTFRRSRSALLDGPFIERSAEQTSRSDRSLLEEVGRRIHDGPTQLLTYIMLRLDELDEVLGHPGGGEQPTARQLLQDVRSANTEALKDLREISQELPRHSSPRKGPAGR